MHIFFYSNTNKNQPADKQIVRASTHSRATQLPFTGTWVCLHWHVRLRSRVAASTVRHSECVTLQSPLAMHGSPSDKGAAIKNACVAAAKMTLTCLVEHKLNIISVRFWRHAIVLTVHYFLILDGQPSDIFYLGHKPNASSMPLLSHMSSFDIEEHV